MEYSANEQYIDDINSCRNYDQQFILYVFLKNKEYYLQPLRYVVYYN